MEECDVRPRSLVQTLIRGDADSTAVQFARYTVVGGAAFLLDFGTLFALTDFGHVHYLVSAAVAFIAGLSLNYVLSRAWVFNRRTMSNGYAEFAVFTGIGVAGLGLNELGLWVLKGVLGIHYLLAKLATTAVVFIWNFAARKYSLFR